MEKMGVLTRSNKTTNKHFSKNRTFVEDVENTILASVMKKEEDTVVMVSTGEYTTENKHQQRVPDNLEDSTEWLLQRV